MEGLIAWVEWIGLNWVAALDAWFGLDWVEWIGLGWIGWI